MIVFWPNADKVKVRDSPRGASGYDELLCGEGVNRKEFKKKLEVAAGVGRGRAEIPLEQDRHKLLFEAVCDPPCAATT